MNNAKSYYRLIKLTDAQIESFHLCGSMEESKTTLASMIDKRGRVYGCITMEWEFSTDTGYRGAFLCSRTGLCLPLWALDSDEIEQYRNKEEKPVIVKWYGATGEFKPTHIIDGVAYFGKEFMREVDAFGSKQVYAPLPFTENVEMHDTAAIRKHKIDRWCVSQFGGFYYGVIQY